LNQPTVDIVSAMGGWSLSARDCPPYR
jgi:hypothetical protein